MRIDAISQDHPYHEACLVYPKMPDAEFQKFMDGVAEIGIQVPILVWLNPDLGDYGEYQILDGRTRFEAARCLGWETVPDEIYVPGPDDGPEVLVKKVFACNSERRNQTTNEKVDIALKMKDLIGDLQAKAAERRRAGAAIRDGNDLLSNLTEGDHEKPIDVRAEIAKQAGISTGTLAHAMRVKEDAPDVYEVMAAPGSKLPVYRAAEIAKLDPEIRAEALEQIKSGRDVGDVVAVAKMSEDQRRDVQQRLETGKAATVRDAINQVKHAEASSDENYTPDWLLSMVRDFFGSPIGFDPFTCEEAQAVVQAEAYLTQEDDAIELEWLDRVWGNPPYSHPLLEQACRKLTAEIDARRVTEALWLTNNGTETKWCQHLFDRCAAFVFPNERLSFWRPGGQVREQNRQGQILFYFGARVERFAEVFGAIGFVGRGA